MHFIVGFAPSTRALNAQKACSAILSKQSVPLSQKSIMPFIEMIRGCWFGSDPSRYIMDGGRATIEMTVINSLTSDKNLCTRHAIKINKNENEIKIHADDEAHQRKIYGTLVSYFSEVYEPADGNDFYGHYGDNILVLEIPPFFKEHEFHYAILIRVSWSLISLTDFYAMKEKNKFRG